MRTSRPSKEYDVVPFQSRAVAAKFEAYPASVRRRMLALRELVFKTAAATPGVGAIEETLKWGEPAYVTLNRAGSTVRIDWKKSDPENYAIYFNCRTNLVELFRSRFAREFRFEGNRALILGLDEKLPVAALTFCVAASLTYHMKKGRDNGPAH